MDHLCAHYDLIIRNGFILDGSGSDPYRADLGIQNARIAAIGDLCRSTGNNECDAHGKLVAPGFIDTHAHDDYALLTDPAMSPKVSQGITTVVIGNCGLSLAPLTLHAVAPSPFHLLGDFHIYRYSTMGDYMAAIESAPPAVNVAVLVGHANLRVNAMENVDREAVPSEIATMSALLDEAMGAGCIGMSSGLAYEASRNASTEELIDLCKRISEFGGIYCTHLRDEGDQVREAVSEALKIGAVASVPVVISHHKCMYKRNWDRSKETLALIECNHHLQEIALDVYPYTASSTVLMPERVDNAEKVIITWSKPFPTECGKDLDDIAEEWACTRLEAAEKLCPGGGSLFHDV